MTNYGQEIIASAIYRGFKEYKEEIDRRSNLSVIVSDDPAPVQITETSDAAGSKVDQILFRVQVASSKNKIATEPSSFNGYSQVRVIQDGRWYKYLVGEENSYQNALELCNRVKADYPDAFVVASKNNRIIPLKDALEEINR